MDLSDLRGALSASHQDGRVKRMVALDQRAREDARVRAPLDELAAQYSRRDGGRVLYVGEPEHAAEAVVFLASDAAAFITGEILSVDGGFSCHVPAFVDYQAMASAPIVATKD